MWFVVRMHVGAEWFTAGWGKITDPTWGTSGTALTGFINSAISKSGGAHPSVQGWYASFLHDFVLPNAGLFSFLVHDQAAVSGIARWGSWEQPK